MKKPLHLNLLTPAERRSSSPVRARIILPVAGGICLAFVLLWTGFIAVQKFLADRDAAEIEQTIAADQAAGAEIGILKRKIGVLRAETEQYGYYLNGRVERGELLRQIAFAIPDGVMLTSLEIPEPPEQNLRPPVGVQAPILQGTTQTVDNVELRLIGLARSEKDIFSLMDTFKGDAFTNLLVIIENKSNPAEESPRVNEFRQNDARAEGKRSYGTSRDVYFDIVYRLKPREYVK